MAMATTDKGRRYNASYIRRRFYTIIFAISVLLVISLLSHIRHGGIDDGYSPLQRRQPSLRGSVKRDEECRLAHHAPDKCAFIKANCPDEEAGLISYLQFYYCKLPHAKSLAFIILIVWLCLLFSTIGIAASDFLCINLSTIATLLGMSESLAGVTFLAFGNGSPDVFSTFAAFNSHSGSLAIGELIGAACFISAVVSGSMAIVRPFKVARKSFMRDVSFFAVAAAFSMSFLADGTLHLWECCVMVGFYVFYVIFVVTWHWRVKKTRARKLREATMRSQFHIPSNQELDVDLRDDEEEHIADERDRLLGSGTTNDFALLEAANQPAWKLEQVDEDDEDNNRELAELRNQMRVSRPGRGNRRNTVKQLRPSLVGALEFRSVLSHLERDRSYQSIPIGGFRRYSDHGSIVDEPIHGPDIGRPTSYHQRNPSEDILSHRVQHVPTQNLKAGVRGRAVSANDAHGLKIDTSILSGQIKNQIDQLEIPSEAGEDQPSSATGLQSAQASPSISASGSRLSSPRRQPSSPGLLAPPEETFKNPSYRNHRARVTESPAESPHTQTRQTIPKLVIPSPLGHVSPTGTFPAYLDSPHSGSRPPSIHLPPPSISPESVRTSIYQLSINEEDSLDFRTFSWWPYKYLPPPQTIISTLFPTIYHWHGKSIYDKILGLVTAPSVFLLAITLPVAETDQAEDQPEPDPGLLSPHPGTHNPTKSPFPSAGPTTNLESNGSGMVHEPFNPELQGNRSFPPEDLASSPKEWNRWLVSVQVFTAPFFVILIVWANQTSPSPYLLLYLAIGSLVFSAICFFAILTFTTASTPPRYRSLLCFLGFLVAIAWIATIANEVVGVLKAFGVILGISDAILGLTIFAVGNSVGDLVADITVARLGFPMMALSACFGGPMLNILLGIGVSGVYMTVSHGLHKHEKHPDRPLKYKPYSIDVSTTLIISGVTLLFTLVGLLVIVPLNKWKMDRKIGIGLIALWGLSTIGNVVVEVLGVGQDDVTS